MPETSGVYDRRTLSQAYKSELVILRDISDGLSEPERQLYGRSLRKAMSVSAMVGTNIERAPFDFTEDQLGVLRSKATAVTNRAFGLISQSRKDR